jgi:hypothetical protein
MKQHAELECCMCQSFNKMNIEISETIVKGNKAYYANAKLIK